MVAWPTENPDHTFKAADTEPHTYNVGLTGEDNLDNFASGAIYARKQGASANHVDGATVTVNDSASKELKFDPVGAASDGEDAFDTGDEGDYRVYTLITWSSGRTTRHPGEGFRDWRCEENFE